jgi:hypothetical protein
VPDLIADPLERRSHSLELGRPPELGSESQHSRVLPVDYRRSPQEFVHEAEYRATKSPSDAGRVLPEERSRSDLLSDTRAPGVRLVGHNGANAQHTLFHIVIVEADDVNAIRKFLWPQLRALREHGHTCE